MNKWKEDADPAEIEATVADLFGVYEGISEIQSWTQGHDLRLTGGSYDLVLISDFADQDSWKRYIEHPEHRRVVEQRVIPLLAATAVVHYEVHA